MERKLRRRRPSPSFVISCIALFVALGGTAWALGANTVGTNQVIDDSLLSQDLKDGQAVKSSDVDNNSLTGEDISEPTLGQVPSAKTANRLVSTFHDGNIGMPQTNLGAAANPIATLDLPAGDYLIIAKFEVVNAFGDVADDIQCSLNAGGDSDILNFGVGNTAADHTEGVTLTVVHHFGRPGTARLLCSSNTDSAAIVVIYTKVTAIQAATLTNTGF